MSEYLPVLIIVGLLLLPFGLGALNHWQKGRERARLLKVEDVPQKYRVFFSLLEGVEARGGRVFGYGFSGRRAGQRVRVRAEKRGFMGPEDGFFLEVELPPKFRGTAVTVEAWALLKPFGGVLSVEQGYLSFRYEGTWSKFHYEGTWSNPFSLEETHVERILDALSAAVLLLRPVAPRVVLEGVVGGGEGGAEERCPYCRDGLRAGASDVTACPSCQTAHHSACLDELGGCTVLGCAAAPRGRERA